MLHSRLLLLGIIREVRLHSIAVLGAATLGAVPMIVHGYLIVLRASRLF